MAQRNTFTQRRKGAKGFLATTQRFAMTRRVSRRGRVRNGAEEYIHAKAQRRKGISRNDATIRNGATAQLHIDLSTYRLIDYRPIDLSTYRLINSLDQSNSSSTNHPLPQQFVNFSEAGL